MKIVLARVLEKAYSSRMETPLTYNELIDQIRPFPVGVPVRVEKKVAKQLLMENRAITNDGRVFYFGIRDIGLGVCEVWKRELGSGNSTKMFPKQK